MNPSRLLVLEWLTLLLATWAVADEAPEPCPDYPATDAICETDIARLHPTQFGVGLLQVTQERAALEKQDPAARHHTILKKRVAVVVGPDDRFWLVDRHHLTRALWEMGERRVPVQIVGRIEQPEGFWERMSRSHWAWLFDERGNPRDPEDLPAEVKDLPDYPYRSLAGFAEQEQLFSKPGAVYFIEFAWAKYFGDQLGWAAVTPETLRQRLDEARRVACLPAAAALPGFPGAVCTQPPER